ncbi:MAG TPA: Holliday junction resolvase RuvX [Vicinamibacteria bacterium]|nr:Holliday junction resolvase RuvX [Vicinamibacteria bacterium]
MFVPVSGRRYLGLDVGDRRIGVALSDETATLASPLTTLRRSGGRRDLGAVAEIVGRHEVVAVVVGLPLNMDGTRGRQAEKVLAFVEALRARLEVPVAVGDERLTTVEAEERLRESGLGWTERRRVVDQAAAVVILQEYLDHLPSAVPAAGRA